MNEGGKLQFAHLARFACFCNPFEGLSHMKYIIPEQFFWAENMIF